MASLLCEQFTYTCVYLNGEGHELNAPKYTGWGERGASARAAAPSPQHPALLQQVNCFPLLIAPFKAGFSSLPKSQASPSSEQSCLCSSKQFLLCSFPPGAPTPLVIIIIDFYMFF